MRHYCRKSLAGALFLFGWCLAFSLAPSKLLAETIEYALLSEGASVFSVSSELTGFNQTMRDNLLRPVKEPWLGNGETGFIFAQGDTDQTVIVDLGQSRVIDRAGAALDAGADRPVWDYVGISIGTLSGGSFSWTPLGHLGTKNDGITDVTEPIVYFSFAPATGQYVKYEFGEYTHNYGGGSRVAEVYAQSTVPLPGAVLLLAPCLVGLLPLRRKLRVQEEAPK